MRLGVVLLLTFAVREIVCIGVEHQLACNVPSGPLDDAKCDVNDIESANTKQLHTILEELANTTYFRLMHINLDGKCRFFEKAVAEAAKCSAGVTQHDLFSPASSEGFSSSPTQPEPLCSVAPGEAQTSASSSGSVGDAQASESSSKSRGSSYFDVSFLTNPLEYLGVWGNAPEEKKELVTNLVDRTISDMEGKSLMDQVRADEESCNNPLLPEFWADMCSNIPTNVSEYVNLQLNPERWTGYNGSHIWNAIYHENCFAKMGGLQEMCYEERVLYRLLSGMHASVNIHIAMSFSPPSRAKNRTSWASSPKHFMDQYGNKPEYLKNLYFAFVVLLRAVRRAGPYLHHWQFTTGSGSPEVARTTQQLVRRLLDSGLMTSCSSVFEAFDESLMFPADDLPSPVSSGSETSATSSSVSVKARLRSQWKGVFHNISSVMDCISCQKCRLHGKIQLLGIGTALKILLLPVTHISASLERSELVALFNTLAKFSSAILAIPRLVDEYLHLVGAFKADLLAENAALPPLPAAALYGSRCRLSLPPPASHPFFWLPLPLCQSDSKLCVCIYLSIHVSIYPHTHTHTHTHTRLAATNGFGRGQAPMSKPARKWAKITRLRPRRAVPARQALFPMSRGNLHRRNGRRERRRHRRGRMLRHRRHHVQAFCRSRARV